MLGLEDLYKYVDKYGLTLPAEVRKLIGNNQYPKIPWEHFVNDRNREFSHPDAIDLLSKML